MTRAQTDTLRALVNRDAMNRRLDNQFLFPFEIGALEAAIRMWSEQEENSTLIRHVSMIDSQTAEIARLGKIIADAPHAVNCCTHHQDQLFGPITTLHARCDCWKSRVEEESLEQARGTAGAKGTKKSSCLSG